MNANIPTSNCLSCNVLSGKIKTPGGIVYEDAYWIITMRAKPLRSPFYPFIILKRHCEHVHELSSEEAAALGEMMRRTAQVAMDVIKPAKVHFGMYAEQVKHLHVHVFPRMPSMPTGNIPNQRINRLYAKLAQWGLKKPYPDEQVADAAAKMRAGFERLE